MKSALEESDRILNECKERQRVRESEMLPYLERRKLLAAKKV